MRGFARLTVCLLVVACSAPMALAQFPKIKLPKGIPGKSNPAPNPVQRPRAGTPGVVSMSVEELTSGKSSDVILTVQNFALEDGAGVADGDKVKLPGGIELQGYGACRNLTKVSAKAPDKIMFTVNPASGSSSCDIGAHSDSSGYLNARFHIVDAEAARQKADAERQQKEMLEQQRKAYGVDKANFGKAWAVQLGSQKDTWTYVGEDGNGMMRTFKNSKGDQVKLIYFNGTVQIQIADSCVLQGQMEGNQASGSVMQCPGMSMGDRWTASIK